MKNKKLAIISFILVAVCCVGIGFATVIDTLTIDASAQADLTGAKTELEKKVYFSAVSGGATINESNADVASFTCTDLKYAGETHVYTFTVKNESDLKAVAEPNVGASSNTKYFSFAGKWVDEVANDDIAAGNSRVYQVTVTLLETPVADQSATCTITLGVNFEAN